jgi:hypothetical protein
MYNDIPEVKLNYTFADRNTLLEAIDNVDFDEYLTKGTIVYTGKLDSFVTGLFKQYGICGGDKNLDTAFAILEQLPDDSDSLNQLGLIYWHHKKNARLSFVMWYRSYHMGNKRAAVIIARYSQELQNPSIEVETIKGLYSYALYHETGCDVNTRYLIAKFHRYTTKDIEMTKKLLLQCAKKGHVRAIADLASIHENDHDYETALNLLNKVRSTGYSYVLENIELLESSLEGL